MSTLLLHEGKITIDHRCCWGVHWKDINQMAQESNTARTIAVMRTGPLSRPFILAPQQIKKIHKLWCQFYFKTQSNNKPHSSNTANITGYFSTSGSKQSSNGEPMGRLTDQKVNQAQFLSYNSRLSFATNTSCLALDFFAFHGFKLLLISLGFYDCLSD